jgi:hypothetical protein
MAPRSETLWDSRAERLSAPCCRADAVPELGGEAGPAVPDEPAALEPEV